MFGANRNSQFARAPRLPGARRLLAALALLLCGVAAQVLLPQAPLAAPYPPVTSLTVNTFPSEIGVGQWTPVQVIVLNYENFEWTRDNVYIKVLRDDAGLIDGGRLDLPQGVVVRHARQRTVTGTMTVASTVKPGAYPLELQLARTSNGQVMGVKFTTTVNVKASGLVRAQGLQLYPTLLTAKDKVWARFTITNAGAAPTTAQTLQFYASPDQGFWSTRDLSKFGWQLVADVGSGPSGRWGAAMAFDTRRGRMLLFGGNANGLLGDTWEYASPDRTSDQPGWKALSVAGPSAREGAAMAYDNSRGRMVLFGGGNAKGALGDTWEYVAGSGWTRITTPTAPSPRRYAKMVYDSGRRKLVLFGGNGTAPLNDMWEYESGAGWSQVAQSGGPSIRYGHGMAYDVERGRILVYGGRGFGRVTDQFWQYTRAAGWTQLPDPPFNVRENHAMIYDIQRDRLVVFGGYDIDDYRGETWTWSDDQGWRQTPALGPNTRANFAAAYDSGRGKLMVCGGWDSYYVADSWELLLGGNDALLGQAQLDPVAPGQSRSLQVELDLSKALPLSLGAYWIGLIPDAYGVTRGEAGTADSFLFPQPINVVKTNAISAWSLFE